MSGHYSHTPPPVTVKSNGRNDFTVTVAVPGVAETPSTACPLAGLLEGADELVERCGFSHRHRVSTHGITRMRGNDNAVIPAARFRPCIPCVTFAVSHTSHICNTRST